MEETPMSPRFFDVITNNKTEFSIFNSQFSINYR